MAVTATIDPGITLTIGGEVKTAGVQFTPSLSGSVLCDQVNDALATATTDTPWTLSGSDYPSLIYIQSLTPSASGTSAQPLFVSVGCNSHAIGMGIKVPAGGFFIVTPDNSANNCYQTAFSTADDIDSVKIRNESGNTAAYRVVVLR